MKFIVNYSKKGNMYFLAALKRKKEKKILTHYCVLREKKRKETMEYQIKLSDIKSLDRITVIQRNN